MPELKDVISATPLVVFFLILAWAYYKGLPAWQKNKENEKEVKLAELKVREKEAEVRAAEASSIGRLTEVCNKSTEATEEMRIFLRAAMRQNESIVARLDRLEVDVDQIRAGVQRGSS